MTRACAVSQKKEQILRFVDAQKSVLAVDAYKSVFAVDAYKRLGDYMLRNEFGTTRPFGKSPKLNERETQRKNEQTFTKNIRRNPSSQGQTTA